MSDQIAISVKNVSKNFRLPHEKVSSVKSMFVNMFQRDRSIEVQHALKDISFDVKQGEFFGIVGRNGSGKSTLLKIIAGIYQPTTGKVQIAGKLVPFIELGVGFNPELTGRENVYLSGALNGFSDKEIDEMYDEIVNFAELEEFMDQKLKNYSSGMQVRLAFSVATRSKADILLIDEVLAVGDADFQRKCFNYFQSLKENNITVVFVSHDMSAVREFCDKAVLINDNELTHAGTADEIANEYVKLFASKNASNNDSENRWGDRALTYNDVSVVKKDESDYGIIEITATIQANKDVNDAVLGFKISNAAGGAILGTNTKLEHAGSMKIKKDESISIKWSIADIFNTGIYQIEVTAVYDNLVEVADWWTGACTFEIIKENKTPYIVRPETQFTRLDKTTT